MRIAIVGTGISGLAVAHILNRRHEVEVFEANDYIGGHTNTIDVELAGERHAIDTGFMVFNQRTYPGFLKLLHQLGVASRPSDMSFSVRCERSGIEYASRSLSAIFAQRRNLLRPSFRGMLRDILRFFREAPELLAAPDEKATLGEFVTGRRYSREFVDHYLVPMGAAIWSAPPDDIMHFPAQAFVRFFWNHGLLDRGDGLHWRVICGGSQRYVDALVRPLRSRIHVSCPVLGLAPDKRGVQLVHAHGIDRFDRVVVAAHGDQALRLIAEPTRAERHVLGAFRYQENEAVLHTDRTLLPRTSRAWASWNYHIPREPGERVALSYHMNRLQGIRSQHDFLVTLNRSDQIDPTRVLRRIRYRHPMYDANVLAAQEQHGAIDGTRGVHFVGAYWRHGFHEDGLWSARRVCRKLGEEL